MGIEELSGDGMTEDERRGIAWWNALTESERARWLAVAKSARPADAWQAFKAAGSPTP